MPRCILKSVALLVALVWTSPARAVDFFWVGPGIGGPGGNFRTSGNWSFSPPPFPLVPAPGGADDRVNFDLGRSPENRYTVTNVNGQNDQMIVHDDSLRLDIGDYQLLSTDDDNPSFLVGVTSGDEADVVLNGVANATLRTKETILGLGVGSYGEVTVDHLQWLVDGELNVGGRTDFIGSTGGDGVLTIQNGSQIASGRLNIGDTIGSIGEVTITSSSWMANGAIGVGGQGIGTLLIQNGSTVAGLGASILGNSTATVDGEGSAWDAGSGIRMFQASNSRLNVQNGARVRVETLGIGCCAISANSSSEITLDSGGILDARGEIEMNTGDFNFLGGTLHVEVFDHHLVNQAGTLAPGNPDQPAGSTNVTGNYTHQSAATLQIEIGGTTQGTQHDFLNVEGTASMAGELELVLINDFFPDADDEFIVFNTEMLWIGSFSNVVNGQRLTTANGGGSFLVHYGPTSSFNANQVTLTDFLAPLDGDHNNDGTVNAADYVVWRKTPEAFGGQQGYDDWRANFGAMLGSGALFNETVPEPASGLLVILGAAAGARNRTRVASRVPSTR